MEYEQAGRLVALNDEETDITLAGMPPIQLRLESEDANNWERLVTLDGRGFSARPSRPRAPAVYE